MKQFHAGEFGEWVLSLEQWQAFGTFTFEREVSTQTASRSFEDCIVRYLPGVKVFYSVERHKAHGGHLHALFAGVTHLHVRSGARGKLLVTDLDGVNLWDVWKRRYGRNSIEIPRDSMHTARYCAKYITKAAALWNYNGTQPFRKRETGLEMLAEYVFPGSKWVTEDEQNQAVSPVVEDRSNVSGLRWVSPDLPFLSDKGWQVGVPRTAPSRS